MPSFNQKLSDSEIWQVKLLRNADNYRTRVRAVKPFRRAWMSGGSL